MRYFAVMLICLFLSGCAGKQANFLEHAEEVSMQTAMLLDIQVVGEDAEIRALPCALPQETGMEQTVADRFVMENRLLLTEDAVIHAAREDDLASLDICGLPRLASAAVEEALISACVKTMTQLPGISRVRFFFDGESLAELPNGTRCFGEFGMD